VHARASADSNLLVTEALSRRRPTTTLVVKVSARNLAASMFGAFLILSALLIHAPPTVADDYSPYDYQIDTQALMILGTSTTSSQYTAVTIKADGLPANLSVTISVDGKEVGSIPGGASKAFDVDKATPHIFLADASVNTSCISYEGNSVCSRYACAEHRWIAEVGKTETCQMVPVCVRFGFKLVCTYEQQCQTAVNLKEKAHTFEYAAEHELVVSDAHGQSLEKWYRAGSDESISAEESIVTKDNSDVRERDIFQDWVVNGVRIESRTLALKMDQPYFVRSEYVTETQYRIRITSEFSQPTTDNPAGWYMKGQEATIQIEQQIPVEGWVGALGGKMVFVAWHSLRGTESQTPKFTFVVEEPVILRAEWRTDYTQPIAIIAIVAVVIVGALVFALYKSGRLKVSGQGKEKQAPKAVT